MTNLETRKLISHYNFEGVNQDPMNCPPVMIGKMEDQIQYAMQCSYANTQ